MNLDNRLKEIVELLGKVKIVVDVGCDHGYVANYLVENNLSDLVYATDISKDSLGKNREYSARRNNEDRVISLVGDGLNPVKDKEFNGVIIAGMGGELIIKILDDSKDIIDDKILVLQPMTASKELRKYLLENGFKIITESIVKDKNKFYEIIKATTGKSSGSKYSYYFGENLIEECDDTLIEYIENLLEKNKSFLIEAQKSKIEKGRERVKKLKEEIEFYEVIINGCKSKRNNRSY